MKGKNRNPVLPLGKSVDYVIHICYTKKVSNFPYLVKFISNYIIISQLWKVNKNRKDKKWG